MTLARAAQADLVRAIVPTPVEPLEVEAATGARLWVKRDDLTHPLYGGNKVRKLAYLLANARARGARRIVTMGAAGSHHVLATTIFGRRAGFEVAATLVPQRATEHARRTLAASLAQGLEAQPTRTYLGAALGAMARARRDAYLIPVGGSNLVGSTGYVDAARELASQVERGDLPEPDVLVVTVGSGGTAAGLAAGLAATRLRTRVLGVVVSNPAFAARLLTRGLAVGCRRRAAIAPLAPLSFTTRYLGDGYGEPTPEGDRATRIAAALGLSLDPTYTAKTFACALDLVRAGTYGNVLFWHTLSSAPLEPLMTDRAPSGRFEGIAHRLLI